MSSSIVNVFVVSLDTRSERRFDLHITVEQLKVVIFLVIQVNPFTPHSQAKLELVTGVPVQNQSISIQNSAGETIAQLSDDTKQLGYYGLSALQTLNVRSIVAFLGSLTRYQRIYASGDRHEPRHLVHRTAFRRFPSREI